MSTTTSSMAELPLFSEPKNSDDSIELSEIESLCTNCEQNVSFMVDCRAQSLVSKAGGEGGHHMICLYVHLRLVSR